MVTVRQATLEDNPAIFEFVKRAYQGRWEYKIPHRWQWEYIDNPFLDSNALPIFIAVEDNGEVIGQIGTLVEEAKIGDEIHRLGWSVDNFVLPEYRSKGIGSQLQKANFEANPIFMSVSMADRVRQIKSRLGSRPIDPVPEYRRYHDMDKNMVRADLLDRILPQKSFFRRSISAGMRLTFLDQLLANLRRSRLERSDRKLYEEIDHSLEIVPIDAFDREVDQLWDRLAPQFYAIIKRDSKYLNWKFLQQPHMEHRRFILRRNELICGYIILRRCRPPENNIGIIADMFVDRQDVSAIQALLTFAIDFFRREQVSEIIAATTIPEYQHWLARLDFRKMDQEVPMIHSKIESQSIRGAMEPGKWFLGRSDHDWDQYPLAR